MLFGCLPVQNIPVFIVMYGVLAFCVWMIWQGHKDEKHAQSIARAERRRRVRYLVEQGRKSRAERMKAYYKN